MISRSGIRRNASMRVVRVFITYSTGREEVLVKMPRLVGWSYCGRTTVSGELRFVYSDVRPITHTLDEVRKAR